MDHDAIDKRLSRVERFLDNEASGWREGRARRDGALGASRQAHSEGLVIDEEQTKNDRALLGLDKPQRTRVSPVGSNPNPGGDSAEAQRGLEPHPMSGDMGALDPDHPANPKNTGNAQAGEEGRAALNPDGNADNLKGQVPGGAGSTRTPAQAVALEGANTNPATEQAMKTEQDPERQKRAAEQQAAKKATESTAGSAKAR